MLNIEHHFKIVESVIIYEETVSVNNKIQKKKRNGAFANCIKITDQRLVFILSSYYFGLLYEKLVDFFVYSNIMKAYKVH